MLRIDFGNQHGHIRGPPVSAVVGDHGRLRPGIVFLYLFDLLLGHVHGAEHKVNLGSHGLHVVDIHHFQILNRLRHGSVHLPPALHSLLVGFSRRTWTGGNGLHLKPGMILQEGYKSLPYHARTAQYTHSQFSVHLYLFLSCSICTQFFHSAVRPAAAITFLHSKAFSCSSQCAAELSLYLSPAFSRALSLSISSILQSSLFIYHQHSPELSLYLASVSASGRALFISPGLPPLGLPQCALPKFPPPDKPGIRPGPVSWPRAPALPGSDAFPHRLSATPPHKYPPQIYR